MNPGEVIADRFQIERFTARGGMGEVYRAIDLRNDDSVALKIVPASDAQSLRRFAREARLLAQLCHPGIVRYLDHGRCQRGELYLAMEWLEGEDLATRLASSELGVRDTLELMTQVTAALAVAHARRIVHRDLKPSNLFLVDWRAARAKVLDFGIARLGTADRLTETGIAVGTPGYMAPEQIAGKRDIDARADVFALGALLFRCLAGVPAFSGESPAALISSVLHDHPPRLSELVRGLPAALDRLVARMLDKEATLRPSDAGAVLGELVAMDGLSATVPAGGRRAEITKAEKHVMSAVVGDAAPAFRQAAQAHGAQLEAAGDGRMAAVFAAQVASDLARQAARCALAMRGPTLAVVTGRGEAGAPAGLVDRALRLLALGGHAIRIDEATGGLLDSRFEVAGDGHSLVLGGERADDDTPRTLLGRATPFVGRDRELAALDAVFAECAGEGLARPILVLGAAGMGKSRLRQELVQRLRARGDDVEVWIGRGDPMRAGAPFALLGEALRRAAGLTAGDTLEARRAALRARLARSVPPERLAAVAEVVGEIAGVPFADGDSAWLRAARRDPVLLGDLTRDAFVELVGAECDVRPLLLVLEDLHWGDLPSVRVVDAALRAHGERPFMVLGLARPEVHALFPQLWADRGLQELNLGPLSRRAAERLVVAALGGADAAVVAGLVDGARGHAFFLEELIRQAAAGRTQGAPETVLAMVASRLEALDPEARRFLRAGSIFGETFWAGGVQALAGGAQAVLLKDELLARLVEAEVIRRGERTRFAGEQEYRFAHALVREAAYSMLTDEDRAAGHRMAGAWLERVGERDAAVVADHLERGGDTARAVGWYLRAAEQALAGNDLDAALARAHRGAACGAAGSDLGRLRLLEATAWRFRGDNTAAERLSLEAMRDLEPGSAAWSLAAGEAVAASGKLDHLAELLRLVDTIIAAPAGNDLGSTQTVALARAALQCFALCAPEAGDALVARALATAGDLDRDPGARAWIESALSFAAWMAGRSEGSARHLVAAGDLFARAGDARNACASRLELGYVLIDLGAHEEIEAWVRPALADAERLGLHSGVKMASAYLALSLAEAGRDAEARALAGDAVARHPELTHPRIACAAHTCRGAVLYLGGQLAAAELELRAAFTAAQGTATPYVLALGWLARLRVAQGDAGEALAFAVDAVARLDPARGVVAHEAVARLALVEALLELGREAEARAALATARDRLDARLADIESPAHRAAFVGRVSAHAKTFALARRYLG